MELLGESLPRPGRVAPRGGPGAGCKAIGLVRNASRVPHRVRLERAGEREVRVGALACDRAEVALVALSPLGGGSGHDMALFF